MQAYEAARESACAQQIMSLACHPAVYDGMGWGQPPTGYTPGCDEDAWASLELLSLGEAPQRQQQQEQWQREQQQQDRQQEQPRC